MDEKKERFEQICKDIKNVKIQGAEAVAIAGLRAYSLFPNKKAEKRLLSLRPTEPALRNALRYAKRYSVHSALRHFIDSEARTYRNVYSIIKNGSRIFVHCHSNTVVKSLVYSRRWGRHFSVLNTETRPLFQGRLTARELSRAGINVTNFVDSAARIAIKESDFLLFGADAVLSDGSVINKIGSGMFAEIAYGLHKSVYIATDSWKFSQGNVKIEERNYKEVWANAPRHIKIVNPAFERIEAGHITAIISELGILKPRDFVKRIKKIYPWLK